jgi:hypothetical protein
MAVVFRLMEQCLDTAAAPGVEWWWWHRLAGSRSCGQLDKYSRSGGDTSVAWRGWWVRVRWVGKFAASPTCVCWEGGGGWGALFRRVRKIAKRDYELCHVCPSVSVELGSHWTDFHEIWYLNIFRNSVEESQVSLISDKSKWHFTWRPTYIFDHISLSFP